jgi:predicted DNA-binding protein YlxM (UPF0122 family)
MLQPNEDTDILQIVKKLANYEKQLKILEQKIVGEQLVREISRQIHQCHNLYSYFTIQLKSYENSFPSTV